MIYRRMVKFTSAPAIISVNPNTKAATQRCCEDRARTAPNCPCMSLENWSLVLFKEAFRTSVWDASRRICSCVSRDTFPELRSMMP